MNDDPEDPPRPLATRRRVLRTLALASVAGVTGCLSDPTGGVDITRASPQTPTPTQTPAPSPTPEPLDYGDELGSLPDPLHSYDMTIGGVPVTVDTMAEDLEIPWSIDFSPDGRIFLTERVGRVRVIGPRGLVDTSYVDPPTVEAGSVSYGEKSTWWVKGGEGGLLGLALHPDFPDTPYLYLYYTYREGDQVLNRVSRIREKDLRGGREEVLLDGIPGGGYHDGGRIKFGPDGLLYVATGEGGEKHLAQRKDSLGGKILRMTPSGDPAPGNPFTGPTASYVYSYGHRNPQGLAWDAEGRLYNTEHGEIGHDEVNRVERGGNYGWPEYQGDEAGGDTTPPTYHAGNQTWAPSGATFYHGDIAQWRGSLFFVGLRGEALHRLVLRDGAVVSHEPLLEGWYGRMRTVVEGPDGGLWFTTSNRDGRGRVRKGDDHLIRIRPRGTTLANTG